MQSHDDKLRRALAGAMSMLPADLNEAARLLSRHGYPCELGNAVSHVDARKILHPFSGRWDGSGAANYEWAGRSGIRLASSVLHLVYGTIGMAGGRRTRPVCGGWVSVYRGGAPSIPCKACMQWLTRPNASFRAQLSPDEIKDLWRLRRDGVAKDEKQ